MSDEKHSAAINETPRTPHVSVVVPCYNVALFIAETLQSALNQTFTDYEIIIVNDGSPDTQDFEKEIAPFLERLIYLKTPNGGAAAARNAALRLAKGKFIAFLDGDDIWFPEYLAEQVAFIEANALDMSYTDALMFGAGKLAGKNYMSHSVSEGEVSVRTLIENKCCPITSGTLVRREFLQKVGEFDGSWVAEDFNLWLRMAIAGAKIGYQKKVLLKYRLRRGSLSGDSLDKIDRSIDVYRRIKNEMSLSPPDVRVCDEQIAYFGALRDVELGKALLLKKNFAEAKRRFDAAARHISSLKLRVICRLAHSAPTLLLIVFRILREEDVEVLSNLKL